MKKTPDIKPIKIKEYEVKQSEYDHVGKLPIRSLLIGPSGSGKTVLLQNLILDIYRDCFSRIYIFSPSVNVDASWSPVKHYIEHDMKIDTKKEKIFFDHYDASELNSIIQTQHKITEHMKKQGHKKLYQILIVIDDFADSTEVSRQSKLLHGLFTRGRHNSISTMPRLAKHAAMSHCCVSEAICYPACVATTTTYIIRLASNCNSMNCGKHYCKMLYHYRSC